jgi:hypothetical protein
MPILKTLSNKFSADVIFTVTLSGQAIANIDPLADCVNLMVLNLSQNSIESIGPLKNLNKLRIVDLSGNSIANVDALANCTELANLNVEGNFIKGLEQLRSLKSCLNLRNLHLQTLGGGSQNPICGLNNYRKNVLEDFPQVKRLDSNSLPTQVSQQVLCNSTTAAKSKRPKRRISKSTSKQLDHSTRISSHQSPSSKPQPSRKKPP